jgi:uncharacterized RDD family membrane protein YckC
VTQPTNAWQAPEPSGGPAPGMEFASPGARLVGYIIDIIIVTCAVIVISILGGLLAVVVPALGVIAILLGVIIVPLAYFPYFWSRTGQTPGMGAMHIKVVRDVDGGPLTTGAAVLRLIGYWVSGFVFYLGYIWIFVDKRKRGWMDLIAGTVVVTAP